MCESWRQPEVITPVNYSLFASSLEQLRFLDWPFLDETYEENIENLLKVVAAFSGRELCIVELFRVSLGAQSQGRATS